MDPIEKANAEVILEFASVWVLQGALAAWAESDRALYAGRGVLKLREVCATIAIHLD
jgi:hypothetical protein